MVGFLGMALAGGAMGARDASNNSVRAQNELEMGDYRERLREEFANRRFDKEIELSRESSKAKAQQDEIKYQRDMEGKKAQYTHEIEKTGLLNKGRMDAASLREAGANARNNQRLSAAEKLAQSKAGGGDSGKGLVMDNGQVFMPNSPEYKLAVDYVKAGKAANLNDAIDIVVTRGLVSQAAGSMQGLRDGMVPTAQDYTGQLFGEKKKDAAQVQRFKLTDLIK